MGKETKEFQKEDVLSILAEVDKNPEITQREISSLVNISLGKTNYLLNSLVDKGLLKIKSFSKNVGKFRKIKYILTPKGMQEKLKITYYFLKKKENEYNLIRMQWEELRENS
jgi:EPS-associated MarR family transcriptional regulator